MSDIHDTLERESGRYAIRDGAFDRLSRRRVRKQRNQRVTALVAGIAIAIAIVVGGSAVLRSAPEPQPADPTRIVHEGEVLEVGGDGLVATDTTTGEQRSLARCRNCFDPFRKFSASVDGRWIAYKSMACLNFCKEGVPREGPWVVGAAGTPIFLGGSWVWAWSPTTDQLVFVSQSKDGTELSLLDPVTGERTVIVTTQGRILALAWSPDGSTIAYLATTPSERSMSSLFVVRPGATSERLEGPSVLFSQSSGWGGMDGMNGFDELAWSPDGTRLGLSTSKGGLIVVPIDGSGGGMVIEEHPGSFAWSPDGRQIAYMDARDVVIVSASGGTPIRIGSDTFAPIDRFEAERWIQARANWFLGVGGGIVWSPDGKLVAFTLGSDWKAVQVPVG
jgi:WD40-like Beta Propeller Repeat